MLGGSSLPFSPLLRLSREFSHTIQYRKIEIPNKTHHGNIQLALIYMNVEIENEAAQFRFWEYMFRIFSIVLKSIQWTTLFCARKYVSFVERALPGNGGAVYRHWWRSV